jgi:NAD(P)H dehydrogenase (quinone)
VAQDYQDGIFAGTNDVIETLTGKPPLTLEEFVARNRAKFAI